MKPRNNKEIWRAYIKFSFSLICSASIVVLLSFFFVQTSKEELLLIGEKTQEYDKVNAYQNELVEKVDTLYSYMRLLNTSEKINDVLLQKMISKKKMSFLTGLNNIKDDDSYLYKKFGKQMSTFLVINDSLRILSREVELAREDLSRCIEDNKKLVRKLSIEGIKMTQR